MPTADLIFVVFKAAGIYGVLCGDHRKHWVEESIGSALAVTHSRCRAWSDTGSSVPGLVKDYNQRMLKTTEQDVEIYTQSTVAYCAMIEINSDFTKFYHTEQMLIWISFRDL